MEQWLESVYSDGTEYFVSNPQPETGETVQIRIRMYEDAPVRHVFLRELVNGEEKLVEAAPCGAQNGLACYEAELKMTENRIQYHFYLVCENVIYYYNQKEITTYIPDHTWDFVLLADYRQPSWVKSAVFYQIFPERFCNGNPKNDVRDGEYEYDGHSTTQMKHWEEKPLPYDQGYCMDFFGGDLEGIREKIPYLKELGVTALYLNPIFHAPTIHKYDCIDYFHVDPHFGGDEALAELSAALHENDMKLILDISINHTGAEHYWFNKNGTFFDTSRGAYHHRDSGERGYYYFGEDNTYYGWAGFDSLPTLNYTSAELRDEIYRSEDSVLRKWLKPPYCIDGWRFDVANVVGRKDEVQLSHEIWPEVRNVIREENPQAYILAEDWMDCAEYLRGNEWDSAMNYYGCGRVLRQFLGLPDLYHGRNEILREIPYRMTAEDVQARIMEHLAKLPYVMWENQFNLIDSHDVPRVHNYSSVNREEYRGAVILQFLLTGTPSVYYGDEVGIDGGTQGDEGFRYPMPWSGIPGRNPETFAFYQKLMHLKKEEETLQKGGMKFLYAKGRVIALARFDREKAYIGIMSTDSEKQQIRLPIGVLGLQDLTEKEDLFGRKLNYSAMDGKSILLEVEAHQSYLIRSNILYRG